MALSPIAATSLDQAWNDIVKLNNLDQMSERGRVAMKEMFMCGAGAVVSMLIAAPTQEACDAVMATMHLELRQHLANRGEPERNRV